MSLINDRGSQTIHFLWFIQIERPFGLLYLVSVEKDGYEILKHHLMLSKNSRLNTFSQLHNGFNVINKQGPTKSDHLIMALHELNSIVDDLHGSSHFQILMVQIEGNASNSSELTLVS
jgi:hypothetical protein